MKKILILSYEFPPLFGGAGTFTSELATGLAQIGHDVSLITGNHTGEFSNEKYNVLRLHRLKFYGKLFYLQLFLYLRKHRDKFRLDEHDVIVLSDLRSIMYSIIFFDDILLAKSIIVFHGSEVGHLVLSPSRWMKLFRLNKKFNRSIYQYKLILTVSDYLKKLLEKNKAGLQHKVKQINHGINLDQFHPIDKMAKSQMRIQLGIANDSLTFVTASRIVKEKGLDNLLNAFKRMVDLEANIFLLILGDGPYLNDLKNQAKELEIERSIIFAGYIKREQIKEYYGCADVFILPTRIKDEGFGLVYIEANACGLPAIGSNIGGVVDAIKMNVNGLLVDPFNIDSIYKSMRALSNDSTREILSKKALLYSKDHSHLAMAEEFSKLAFGKLIK